MRRAGRSFIMMGLVLAVICASAPALSVEVPSGIPALRTPFSVRQMGMGNVSIGGVDILRASSNPALLSDIRGKGEVAIGGGSVFGGEQSDFVLGGGWRFNPDITGGLIVCFGGSSFKEVDAFGGEGEDLYYGYSSVGLAGAYRLEFLNAGLALKAVREVLLEDKQNVFAVDLGLSGDWNGIMAGIAIRNLGPDLRDSQDVKLPGVDDKSLGETLPRELRIGVGYAHKPWNLSGAFEICGVLGEEDGPSTGIGFEWWPAEAFAARAGVVIPPGNKEANDVGPRFTLGLSGVYKSIGLDYALLTHEQMGITNQILLSYTFGPVGEEAASPAEQREPGRKAEPAPAKAGALAAGGKPLNVAVADLTAQGVSSSDAAVMADLLRNELVKTGAFNVIEKQNMDKVLAEHAFQQTGCTSEECAVKLGKLLNVQRMSVGSFGKLLDSYFLNIRVVNVETGEVTYADSVEGKTVGDLKVGVKNLAEKLARQLR